MRRILAATILVGSMAIYVAAQEHQHDPAQHAAHQQEMNARGEKAMGFSQTATTHHFVLLPDGGYVQATANSKDDSKTVEQIRAHLFDIKKRFASGDFSAPELTHGKVPPGVDQMQKLKADLTYNVEHIEGGGRLRIVSKNPKAVAAVHEFLKFQIEDHETGDPTAVQKQ
jgi:hypothetical protein